VTQSEPLDSESDRTPPRHFPGSQQFDSHENYRQPVADCDKVRRKFEVPYEKQPECREPVELSQQAYSAGSGRVTSQLLA
jgi:hypothetical protein